METASNYVLIHGKNISHSSLAGSAVVPHMSIDKLFPALLECFGIIMCGYIAGRADIITEHQAKGLGNFVSKFALPALLFKNMVLLDFGDVIWAFFWSVLVAKVAVFMLVCVLTLMVASPESRYSKAGLYAIFATQSNDFALGYPIVDALYRSTYPEYLQYIYLVAPVSLMLLNPIGFALCEVQHWKQASHPQRSTIRILAVVIFQVLKNPIVFMVIVGIISHFALGQKIPAVLSEFIDGLANSFGGAALFYLGLTMVTSGMVISTFLSAPIMYVSAWLLTIPLMDPLPLVTELQNVSFNISIVCLIALVWTITVMLLSRKFNRLPHLFALNLFLAQFLVCVSMILWNFLVKQEDNLISKTLTFTMLYGSLYSTYIWTGLIPLCLALTTRDDLLRLRPGVFMALGWGVPLIMVGGLLIFGEQTETIDSAFFYGRAQIISTAVVLSVSLVLGAISLMGLSQGDRNQRGYHVLSRAAALGVSEELRNPGSLEESHRPQQMLSSACSINSDLNHCSPPQNIPDMVVSSQREHTNGSGHMGSLCDGLQHPRQSCSMSEQPLDLPPPGRQAPDEKQTVRHVLLCLLLSVSLLANLSSCLWWLFNKDPGRLYLELQFFCAVANYGQGFLSFGIFGLDRHLIILPFKKRLLTMWHGRDGEEVSPAEVAEEVRLTCTQFVRYHKDQCVQDIVHRCGRQPREERRSEILLQQEPESSLQTSANEPQFSPADLHPPHQHDPHPTTFLSHPECTFPGSILVDWLVERGLSAGRVEAERYGGRLWQGGVLAHMTGQERFKDTATLLYHFTSSTES
ncbi:integral membrane protein GPR155 isoform X5 [Synchiropus splendidus]|uniref:integral membrane protein GPR155 isoform X5 n=1 Tax=Synchiropus splendidus TaxID=270530 RepID=UPI00237E8300|nr:integral membrane protein GPR155 isoform X5 [Synchiropus splendidus]